ncbi:MotA/TolQ/ExbB proton channel family protein [Thalassobaculum sp.]|uniref:MotA/TolQ/ExbB proton channel family protein n=1 Tax=Thalassobaculum sp. TaxID=2022740 RepID=UPI0032EBBA71
MTAFDPALSTTALDPSVPRAGTRHAPLYQFAALNLPALALLAMAWHRGWLDTIISADPTRLTVVIIAVFVGGMVLACHRLWRLDQEIECAHSYNPNPDSWARRYRAEVRHRSSGSRNLAASTLRIRVTDYIAVIRHIAASLVLLGLIGTVVGFIVALSGVDPAKAADVSSMTPMVATLIQGMSVALYTTLAGAVANLWLTVNYRLVASTAVRLLADLVAIGEADARP